MLQKLSKCEVKAWLWWNLIILLPLRFYVKSNFGEFKRSKNVIFGNFRDSELWIFGKFGTWKLLKFTKNQNSEALKLPKMSFLDYLFLPKFDFTQNQSGSKIIKFQQSLALTSHFESFWSIVECHSALLFGIKCLECFLVSYFSFLSGDQLLLIPTPLQIDSKDFIMKKWIIRKNRPKV